MATLTTLIPDVDILISLAPEELAEVILQLAFEHKQSNNAYLQAVISEIYGATGLSNGYPQNRHKEAELVVAEAWSWLIVQGLIIPQPGSNGTNGWMLLTRRGQKLLDNNSFKTYTRSMAFLKGLLHPSIADEVWLDIVRGDIETVVFKAFRADWTISNNYILA